MKLFLLTVAVGLGLLLGPLATFTTANAYTSFTKGWVHDNGGDR
jgi:hypothetical protein